MPETWGCIALIASHFGAAVVGAGLYEWCRQGIWPFKRNAGVYIAPRTWEADDEQG